MLLQPFIENAIKHGFDPNKKNTLNIFFEMNHGKQFIQCKIYDNAVGFPIRIQTTKIVTEKYPFRYLAIL